MIRSFSHHSDLGMVVLAIRRELEKARVRPRHPPTPSSSRPTQQQTASSAAGGGPDQAVLAALRTRLATLSQEELKELLNEEDEEGGLDTLLEGLRADCPSLGQFKKRISNHKNSQSCGSGSAFIFSPGSGSAEKKFKKKQKKCKEIGSNFNKTNLKRAPMEVKQISSYCQTRMHCACVSETHGNIIFHDRTNLCVPV